MSKLKITRNESTPYGRSGVKGWNYPLPTLEGGLSWVYAELTGEHGERTTTNHSRIYYVIEGTGEFVISGEKIEIESGDVIPIPPKTTYNYWPNKGITLKVVLIMELFDPTTLPRK